MSNVHELYEASVRPMAPAARLQLARLIPDDLAGSEKAVDISDQWGADDLAELSAYAAQQADRHTDFDHSNQQEPALRLC